MSVDLVTITTVCANQPIQCLNAHKKGVESRLWAADSPQFSVEVARNPAIMTGERDP
jgi:hypothetical protein